MPYGDFVVDSRADVVLFAGGTGITAFTAFLEGLTPADAPVGHARLRRADEPPADLPRRRGALRASGCRRSTCPISSSTAARPMPRRRRACVGRVSVDAVWPRLGRPFDTAYYISGPPPMLQTIGQDLRARDISPEAIHIDAWE